MMLSELKAGQAVLRQAALVRVQKVGVTSKGGVFARGILEDNSGHVAFICFETALAEKMRNLEGPTAFLVSGTVDINKIANDMSLQLLMNGLSELVPGDDVSNLVPMGNFDVEAYKNKLMNYIKAVRTPTLRKLLETVFSGNVYDAFVHNPAGMKLHHAYIGGLLQHSIDVADLAVAMADRVEGVDKDLVISGALLHDLGKIKEISSEIGFPYTNTGRFMGHIVITSLMVQEVAAKLNIPANRLEQLQNILLSHHGENEKGSPVACSTREAFIVHYADEINAIMNQFEQREGKGAWEYNRMLGRNLLKENL